MPDESPPEPLELSRIPDAVPRPEPLSRYGNIPSYQVDGRTYHTLRSSHGYRERGVASWYGSEFQGRLTSNREPYDMYAMSAAHKTLPLPTYARVTNLANGRSVVVRINDRGPFHADRIIDLSYTAAAKLDILQAGTGLVEVQALDPWQPRRPPLQPQESPPPATPRLFVQVGAFASRSNATRLYARLSAELAEAVRVQAQWLDPHPIYRVQVGPLVSVERADELARKLLDLGLGDTHLVVD
jgi:rare lipoprotein A